MDTIRITNDNMHYFDLILTADAIDAISQYENEIYALGAVIDGLPVGTGVVRFKDDEARLISLYVVEEYRKQGIGTEICSQLLNTVMSVPDITSFNASYTEKEGEEAFTGFFESLYFDIEKVGVDYTITVMDTINAPELQKIKVTDSRAIPYNKLTSKEKNLLLNEETDLTEYIKNGQLREDLSFVILDDKGTKIRCCLIFAEVDNELVVAWANTTDAVSLLAKIILSSFLQIEAKEPLGKVIHLPAINEKSDKLLHNLFGNLMKIESTSYEASFSLE